MKVTMIEVKPYLLKNNKIRPYFKDRVGNFWSNNYIEYESNDDRSKTLSVEEQ